MVSTSVIVSKLESLDSSVLVPSPTTEHLDNIQCSTGSSHPALSNGFEVTLPSHSKVAGASPLDEAAVLDNLGAGISEFMLDGTSIANFLGRPLFAGELLDLAAGVLALAFLEPGFGPRFAPFTAVTVTGATVLFESTR
jgi:hypothetical protein